MRGFVLCVSGPSGSGKTSLCDRLTEMKDYARRSISVTTRPRRPGEISGRDYIFVSHEEFRERLEAGDFLESAEVFGNWYATPLKPVEEALQRHQIIVMDIDTVGARHVKERFAQNCVSVFILPPSMEELEKRLRERKQNTPEDLARRLQEAAREISESADYDYRITNLHYDRALQELSDLVELERQKTV
jgi:guanylate kinase